MAEASEPHEVKPQRVFISYSRADRQRVAGLASLLEALEHDVFMDQRSIRPGKRWKKKLEEELQSADVLLVFWTRHAARSDWVRREYESFEMQHPDRLLVPVLGDTTPLTEILQTRQYSDFCPLINELLATVSDLEEKGVGKRKIRAVVLKRLEEEGIELPRDRRNRLFGLFGIFGLTIAPLYFLQIGRDFLIDRASALPTAYIYTAGAAAAAGVITCQVLSVGEDSALTPKLFPVAIVEDQSGNDACDAQGKICVSVSRARIFDENYKFFGFSTPPCSAKVIRKPSCQQKFNTSYSLTGIVVRRSPEADEGVLDVSGRTDTCLSIGQGPQGRYEFANCVEP